MELFPQPRLVLLQAPTSIRQNPKRTFSLIAAHGSRRRSLSQTRDAHYAPLSLPIGLVWFSLFCFCASLPLASFRTNNYFILLIILLFCHCVSVYANLGAKGCVPRGSRRTGKLSGADRYWVTGRNNQ